MEYHIGCSGYYYPQWKNTFYPTGMPPRKWLEHYSTLFNTVEMNGTFYRQPKLPDLKKYALITPDDFTFSVKMSRYISHVQRLREKQSIDAFQKLITDGLGEKVTHFLFQMPPNFHYSDENLERIVENVPNRPDNVIEFRHSSWWTDTVVNTLQQASLTFCNVDFPGLDSHIVETSPFFYLRMHGSPELFASSYSDETINTFYNQIPESALRSTIYFNNTIHEAGFQNALTMKSMAQLTHHA